MSGTARERRVGRSRTSPSLRGPPATPMPKLLEGPAHAVLRRADRGRLPCRRLEHRAGGKDGRAPDFRTCCTRRRGTADRPPRGLAAPARFRAGPLGVRVVPKRDRTSAQSPRGVALERGHVPWFDINAGHHLEPSASQPAEMPPQPQKEPAPSMSLCPLLPPSLQACV